MTRRPRSKITFDTPNSYEGKPRSGSFIILGLIGLQIVLVLAALIFLPTEQRPADLEVVAALDAPPAVFVEPAPVLPVQPVLPTPEFVEPSVVDPPLPVVPTPEQVAPAGPLEPALLRVRGVEVTQGIQVFNEPVHARCNPTPGHPDIIFCNNSIPLVAGRHTLVRVYLACNLDCPAAETTVQLRLLKDGREQTNLTRQLPADMLWRVNPLPLNELRLDLAHSVNFEFFPPPDWLSGQITFEVAAAPVLAGAVGGATIPAGTAPATATFTQDFAVRKPLRVAYLPIQYQGIAPPDPPEIDYWLRRMYPVPEVEYYRLPVPDLVWDGELSKSDMLGKLLYIYWLYAQNHPTEAWPDQLFGWLPMEYYNGGISDPFWCPHCAGPHSSRVAFGGLRPEQDIGGPRILVHEIAHNLGAQHAWSPTYNQDNHCFKAEGADIQVDPDWPYADTPHTQEFGIDLYSNPPVIYSPSYYDMMAYCTHPWISPHTYRKIFNSPFLQTDAAAVLPVADFRPQLEAQDNGALLVSGIVYPDGTVSRPEVIRLVGSVSSAFTPPVEFIPPPGDDYCLNVHSTDNALLAQHCFDVGFLDLETGEMGPSPYFFTLPDTDARDVGQVSISKNQLALVIITPSNSPPQVNVLFPNGGESLTGQQAITWEASDADGDPLTYDLLYSPDNGQTWSPLAVGVKQSTYTLYADQLAPTHDALIRVMAHDGFHTAIDESDAPFTIAAPQENSISLRGPASVKPGQTFDVVVTANAVTEPGLFGVQFKLNFDPALLQLSSIRLHPDLDLVVDDTIDNQA
ncbi:cohesin domain-containing protein, partial [Chloroflexota bacterium]